MNNNVGDYKIKKSFLWKKFLEIFIYKREQKTIGTLHLTGLDRITVLIDEQTKIHFYNITGLLLKTYSFKRNLYFLFETP